ncbi:hypothetical protein [Neobacillus terrae]|uniref:hypothetical protein n=1 Tax=Neobacillus terrae TaxID=3034837 RepID=UPI00140D315F|nr:hypothetical protein [Neobacillus terrae]NHM29671.1 hypothetical protein [Neobacillus terrae]
MIRLMPVGGPQDVGQEGVATGRGDFSLSSSNQGACAFCSDTRKTTSNLTVVYVAER